MAQHLKKAKRTIRSESNLATEFLSDGTTDQYLSTATELCLLYLQCEKLLKKQEILIEDARKDVC